MSCIRSIFITGANRGLGLEFVKQFVALPTPPHVIFATCRNVDGAKDLKAVANSSKKTKVILMPLDLNDDGQILKCAAAAESELAGEGLNLLINNAGMYNKKEVKLSDQNTADLMAHFHANCVAPLMLTKALWPLLKTAAAKTPAAAMSASKAAVVMVSTKMASMDDNTSGQSYQYRISKAGLNMATKNLSIDLKPDGILVMPIHPGWVRTDMGGPDGLIDVPESVSGMVDVITHLSELSAGQFVDYKGRKINW